ncbi:MAG: protein-L-isoaspartate(D-aspartate) O-methyltransferase [Thermoanaerobaculia bacterium]|nr:protein-L-isoaspartate(D-aspartate) O-methyltransferase [Thermoanaerobaculia bacterium]
MALFVLVAPLVAQDGFRQQRDRMVEQQIRQRGITSPSVLAAMSEVPRHRFVDSRYWDRAYEDQALPIGDAQAVPQPYLVALMTSLLELDGDERVLEIGTGSGYQAAILARLAGQVYSIEILEDLGDRARRTLDDLGFRNVEVVIGDGYRGLPDAAPFDGILVTAAPARVPQPLLEQLKVGGRMVIPVGEYFQDLLVITRTAEGFEEQRIDLVRLEPMTGEAQRDPE